MNLLLRLMATLVAAARQPRLGPLDEASVGLTVLPSDLDLNGHMNNGRYLSIMDLGRLHLTVRTGIAAEMIRNRWMPVLAGVTIRFRKSLRPWQRYDLRTRIVSWDEDWFYMEQRFVRGETVHAIAHVKGIFLDRSRKKVPVAEILAAAGSDARPPLSPHELALCFANPGKT